MTDDPTVTSPSIAQPTQTVIPTLPAMDGAMFVFQEGRYNRDEACARVFDYHKTSYGELTIVIADNLVEPRDPQYLAKKVVERYVDLYNNSPVPLSNPSTVTILSNPDVGECYSTGNLVFVSPEEVDSRAFHEELLGATTGIHEYWVQVGLAALVLGELPDSDRLKTWYQKTDDLDMAGLFFARFLESWATEEERDIARMSATSLVQYALEVENIQPDKLVEQVDNEVRTRWLASLGVNRTVTYPYDGHFAGFTYSRNDECSLIVQADTMRFCLNRLPDQEYFDEISEVEFLIDYAYSGRKVLAEYLLAEAPSIHALIDPEELITVTVMDLRYRLGYTDGNEITINWSSVYYDPLHEIVHTFDWNNSLFVQDELWLTEGFAEYLGKLLPIYPQTAQRCIFDDLSGHLNDAEASIAPGTSFWYYLDKEQLEAAKAWYLAQGGQVESEESIDVRLYTDAVAFATMYRDAYGGERGIPIGAKYEALHPNMDLGDQDGLELSYTQAASFVAWLCDTYSMDRVLDVYVNDAEGGLLDGKSYEELKSLWLADLVSKGQNIDIPGRLE